MEHFLRYFLVPYMVLFFIVCVLWRAFLVWKQTGINPVRWGRSDGVRDFTGKALISVAMGAVVSVLIFCFTPGVYTQLAPIPVLENFSLQIFGLFLLVESLLWVAIAQAQMGKSWRIGIDQKHSTELVREGFYRFSRNPIYLGMLESALGLLLVLPNAVTLTVFTGALVLLHIQVRLEEEHMITLHGETFREYCRQVRRWI